MAEIVLHDLAAFTRAVQQAPRILLFKHSPACPISAMAREEYDTWRSRHEVDTLFVDVIAERPTARGIAGECGVQHQSPQAILFVAGRPAWHASHEAITADALEAAWAPRC
jgi:bacillithiol system protein YtxJ